MLLLLLLLILMLDYRFLSLFTKTTAAPSAGRNFHKPQKLKTALTIQIIGLDEEGQVGPVEDAIMVVVEGGVEMWGLVFHVLVENLYRGHGRMHIIVGSRRSLR